jgi:hypothetical protein
LGLITEIKLERESMNPSEYISIADDIFRMQILPGRGTDFNNTLRQMGERGIPFFTSRPQLLKLAKDFQQAGWFVKHIAVGLERWNHMYKSERREITQKIVDGWEEFERAKDRLIEEINRQISKLG